MSTSFEDDGYTVSDVQSLNSASLHSTILLVLCHGIHTCVFFVALYFTVRSQYPERKRVTFASIITSLWCTNTIIVGLCWARLDQLLITHGTSLETEFSFGTSGAAWEILAINIFRTLNVFLADLILIWRCWVLYGGDWKIVAVPSLCLIIELTSACFLLFYAFVGVDLHAQATWGLVYYSMTVATNSLCTFLLLFRSMRFGGLLGASLKMYSGIIGVLVESAAMYAVIYIALLVVHTYEFYSPGVMAATRYTYPLVISYSITGIAPTLIIARVMAGQSRPDDACIPPTLPNTRITMHSIAEPLRFASASSHGTGSTRRVTTIDLEEAVSQVENDEGPAGGDERDVEAPPSLGKRTHVTFSEASLDSLRRAKT